MAGINDIHKQIQKYTENLPNPNYALGRTLMQPFKPTNSGSRALMNSVHVEHFMVLSKGEVPIIQTGYESEFGETSSSYIEADADYEVIAKIQKFEHKNDHYYLITHDLFTDEYDVIERIPFKHNTESFGYLWNNDKLDCMEPGYIIKNHDVIKTSNGFDEYHNKMNGVNLNTVYLSCGANMEDSVIISESAAKKLETNLIKSTEIMINDNDVLLNLYGDDNNYKTFPDVGEYTKDEIFCSIRRVENDNILYSLSQKNLKDIMISDRNITMNGLVADIDVYCNNPDDLGDSHYNRQLYYYYQQMKRFSQEIIDVVAPLAMNNKLSYDLQALYAKARDFIGGKQFFKDKLFNGVVMSVTVIESLPMNPGDKMCNRYGGKGVVSEVLPDNMMPQLSNGKVVEVIMNQSTCYNRENIGQLNEMSLTFIQMRLLDRWKMKIDTPREMFDMYCKYVDIIDPQQGEYLHTLCDIFDDTDCQLFMESIFQDDCIILSLEPMTSDVDIDAISKLYEEFPWIKQYEVYVPLETSNGDVRYIQTRRNLVAGPIYYYRLKQYAEDKFSVLSLSATNLKNLNTRSKANKVYEGKYTKTPIMFGPMESGDLGHLGMQYVVMNLMLYSSSPGARRLFEQLLTGDPYSIDIKLDSDSKNRNAEIINALLQTMGLELVFDKIPKQQQEMVKRVMCKVVPPRLYHPKTDYKLLQDCNTLEMQADASIHDNGTKPMVKNVMCKIVDNSKKRHDEDDN